MKEYIWGETYILTKELEDIQELLSAAVIHGENNGFLIPYSYWIDKKDGFTLSGMKKHQI